MMVRLASTRGIKGQVVSYESNETRRIKSRIAKVNLEQ